MVGRNYDVLDIWRGKAAEVTGRALDCGHFLPEEAPDVVLHDFREFFIA
jgi:haloacetate dehalogenase